MPLISRMILGRDHDDGVDGGPAAKPIRSITSTSFTTRSRPTSSTRKDRPESTSTGKASATTSPTMTSSRSMHSSMSSSDDSSRPTESPSFSLDLFSTSSPQAGFHTTPAPPAFPAPTNNPEPLGARDSPISAGSLGGIVVAAVIGTAAIVGLLLWLYHRYQIKHRPQSAHHSDLDDTKVTLSRGGSDARPGSEKFTPTSSQFPHYDGAKNECSVQMPNESTTSRRSYPFGPDDITAHTLEIYEAPGSFPPPAQPGTGNIVSVACHPPAFSPSCPERTEPTPQYQVLTGVVPTAPVNISQGWAPDRPVGSWYRDIHGNLVPVAPIQAGHQAVCDEAAPSDVTESIPGPPSFIPAVPPQQYIPGAGVPVGSGQWPNRNSIVSQDNQPNPHPLPLQINQQPKRGEYLAYSNNATPAISETGAVGAVEGPPAPTTNCPSDLSWGSPPVPSIIIVADQEDRPAGEATAQKDNEA